MGLENLARKLCKWLFLRLEDDLLLKKAYRLDNYLEEIQVLINHYRNIYVELSLEHEIDSFRLIFGKEPLTEKEKEANRKAKREGKRIPYRRGDNDYLLLGIVYDGHKSLQDFAPENGLGKIETRIYNFFTNLKKFYQMEKERTKPSLLDIRIIAEKDGDYDSFKEQTPVCEINPTNITGFLMDLTRYKDGEDELARKSKEASETGDAKDFLG